MKAVPTGTSEYLAPAGFVMDEPFDWWSKFYTSLQDPELKQEEYDKLQLDKLVVRLNIVSVCMLYLQQILTWYITDCHGFSLPDL